MGVDSPHISAADPNSADNNMSLFQYEGEANFDAAASGQEGNVANPQQSYGL